MTKPDELDGMPDKKIAITYRFKITDKEAFLDKLPEIGAPKKFPPVTVGAITQIVEKNDNDGNLIATVTVTQGRTP